MESMSVMTSSSSRRWVVFSGCNGSAAARVHMGSRQVGERDGQERGVLDLLGRGGGQPAGEENRAGRRRGHRAWLGWWYEGKKKRDFAAQKGKKRTVPEKQCGHNSVALSLTRISLSIAH